jgi:putative flippase GtrA
MYPLLRRILGWKIVRYGLVGVLNTFLSLGIFNFLLWISGVTQGTKITLFSIITFAIVVTNSFFWNKFLVFKSKEVSHHREYVMFFVVSSCVSLVNVGVITFLVNIVGAPREVSPTLWANLAVLTTIPISVLGNFFGYKIFVFRQPEGAPPLEIENEVI